MALDITTRKEYVEALRATLLQALQSGTQEIVCSDLDFADWPLGEPAVLEALTLWAKPHRRLVLLAQDYEPLQRSLPRFVRWRVTWDHLVQAWTPTELAPGDHPTLLLAGDGLVELLDRPHWRGRVSHEPSDLLRARDSLDVILQRSTPAFAASILGL